jgi:hypothetical protein
VCLNPNDTVPGSPSKCHCDQAFTVPILVDRGQGGATKTATPLSLPEPGGEFTFDIGFKNTSQFVNVTLDRICDDKYGTIAYSAGPACPAGTLGTINSTTCVLPAPALVPNATFSCSFTANFFPANGVTSASAPASSTDTVTFYGHDSNPTPNAVQSSASATVKVTDVAPAGIITKSLDSLRCALVRYKVKAENNNPTVDTLLLTALTDSGFGDITAVQGDVKATTCVLPQGGQPVGSTPYECTFDAYFCGGSHTNSITATWHDNDGNETTPTSNSLTVNVGAQQQP